MEYILTLKAARVNVGMSPEAAAEKIGVNSEDIQAWEAGSTVPPADKFFKLCEVYGVPVGPMFFTRIEIPTADHQ